MHEAIESSAPALPFASDSRESKLGKSSAGQLGLSSEQLFSAALSETRTLSPDEERSLTMSIEAARGRVGAVIGAAPDTAAALSDEPEPSFENWAFSEATGLAVVSHGHRLLARRRLPPGIGMGRAALRRWLSRLEESLDEYRTLRDRMFRANVRLVSMLARRYPGSALGYLDLVQEGAIGLMRAIEKFQPSRQVRFSTYATWWIWQALSRAADTHGALIRTPVHWGQLRRRIARGAAERTDAEGQPASRDELASIEGLDRQRFEEMTATFNFVSTDAPPREGEDRTLESLLASDDTGPVEYAERADLRGLLEEALADLPKREEFILRQRFGLEGDLTRSLEELGQELSVSRERVRQLEVRALNKLKEGPAGSALADYLQ